MMVMYLMPAIVDGSTYKITMGNGTTNDSLTRRILTQISVKLYVVRSPGALGRVVEYLSENLNVHPTNTDILELQLPEPVEFVP